MSNITRLAVHEDDTAHDLDELWLCLRILSPQVKEFSYVVGGHSNLENPQIPSDEPILTEVSEVLQDVAHWDHIRSDTSSAREREYSERLLPLLERAEETKLGFQAYIPYYRMGHIKFKVAVR